LTEIFNLQAKSRPNIFATSTFIPEISRKFEGSPSLETRASEEDMRRYLDEHMFQIPGFVNGNIVNVTAFNTVPHRHIRFQYHEMKFRTQYRTQVTSN
jgi:hypothetical protein